VARLLQHSVRLLRGEDVEAHFVLVHQVDVQADILRLLLARLLLGGQQEGVEGRTVRDSGILSNRAGPTVKKGSVE
jgi:hypothetical protein